MRLGLEVREVGAMDSDADEVAAEEEVFVGKG